MCLSPNAFAGFLDMPEITEMEEFERKSMLTDLNIPGVRDRDPDPESGPRLNVLKFKLQGIVEFPEFGITKAEVDKLIEGIRFDLMQEFKVLKSGYTQSETDEVTDLLAEIEEETMERHVSDLELQKLVWLVREQRSKRGVTLGQIELVADRITSFYRERGFILAKAYIPEQEVRDGVVTLTLLLGALGEVVVSANKIYKSEIIGDVFSNDLALPVTDKMVEENIYLINDYPGLSVQGFFEPGSQVGDTKLNLTVKQEDRYNANVRYDNHGSDETGDQRIYADVLINNLAGQADMLHVAALNSFSPDNTTYWQLQYSLNLFHPRWRLGLDRTQNQFSIAENDDDILTQLDVKGTTLQTDISLTYKLKRSRVENYHIEYKRENISSDLSIGDINFGGILDDEIENNSLSFRYDILQEKSKILHQGAVTIVSGDFVAGIDPGQDESFDIFMSDYTFLTFLTVPYFDANTRLIVRTSLQFTQQPLSSISQFSLGGPTKSRGHAVNQFSADSAAYIGFDWVLNWPSWLDFNISSEQSLKSISQPFLFFDASHGIKKSLKINEEDSEATLYSAGLGFRLFYLNNFQGNLQFSVPLKSEFTDTDLEKPDDGVRSVFDFQYSF